VCGVIESAPHFAVDCGAVSRLIAALLRLAAREICGI
jgi:hypothetical protein